MQATDVVRLRNTGNDPWKAMYASQIYKMLPGQECIAPFIAACNWFGHPDAMDGLNPRERFRTDEVARLRVYYGVYDDAEKWETNMPKVQVYDLDGNRILTVLDDPEGDELSPALQTVAEKQNLEFQLDQLKRQMKQMQTALDIQTRQSQAETQGDLIEDDLAPFTTPPLPTIPDVRIPNDGNVVPPDSTLSENVSEDTPTKIKVSST